MRMHIHMYVLIYINVCENKHACILLYVRRYIHIDMCMRNCTYTTACGRRLNVRKLLMFASTSPTVASAATSELHHTNIGLHEVVSWEIPTDCFSNRSRMGDDNPVLLITSNIENKPELKHIQIEFDPCGPLPCENMNSTKSSQPARC